MKKTVPSPAPPWPSLEEIEVEVEAEAREYGRRRLQERLPQLADQHGEVFPRSGHGQVAEHEHVKRPGRWWGGCHWKKLAALDPCLLAQLESTLEWRQCASPKLVPPKGRLAIEGGLI